MRKSIVKPWWKSCLVALALSTLLVIGILLVLQEEMVSTKSRIQFWSYFMPCYLYPKSKTNGETWPTSFDDLKQYMDTCGWRDERFDRLPSKITVLENTRSTLKVSAKFDGLFGRTITIKTTRAELESFAKQTAKSEADNNQTEK